MPRKAWLRSLLVACLAVHVGAYIVETGDTRTGNEVPRAQNPDLAKKEANRFHLQRKAKQQPVATTPSPSSECVLPPGMADEIKGYQKVVDRIIDYVTTGDYKGKAYSDLADLVDIFGPRMAGSDGLEGAIDWMVNKSVTEKLDNVHTEDVRVPHWVRNQEFAWMTQPRLQKFRILGLAGSVATPPEGITAEVLVVKTFDELAKQSKKVAGKIVLFNPTWETFKVDGRYNGKGATEAAKLGAVAALVRSKSPFSIGGPHTGNTYYTKKNKIPVASLTIDDAAMLERMQTRGQKIAVKLVMGAQTYADTISRNTVAEVLGTHQPNEKVVVSGHLDTMDVSPGVMDDAGGVMVSWAALVVMKKLKLMPRRTVRAVFWTSEVQGLHGAKEYFKRHKHDYKQFQLMMESDGGTFTPQGISFTGSPEGTCIMKEVLKLLHRINATQVTTPMEYGPDIKLWEKLGVSTAGLNNDNSRFIWYHLSEADNLNIVNPDILDRCLALWTSVAFVLADMKERLPHHQARRQSHPH